MDYVTGGLGTELCIILHPLLQVIVWEIFKHLTRFKVSKVTFPLLLVNMYITIFFVFLSKATMDRLAKLKITCSNLRIRAKFDLLGENHGKEIADLQQKMSKEEELVVEKEKRVVTLAEMCSLPGHACGPPCIENTKQAKRDVKQAKLDMQTGFAIAFDNIDGRRERKHMTKDNQNLDFHWVNHKIIMNRVSGNGLDTSARDICGVSNIQFLPTVPDQKRQRQNYIVLVSRILVEHLECFSFLKEVCICHIPHKYSKEMAKKSETVSL